MTHLPLDISRPHDLREQSISIAFSEWLAITATTDLKIIHHALETMAMQMESEITRRTWREVEA